MPRRSDSRLDVTRLLGSSASTAHDWPLCRSLLWEGATLDRDGDQVPLTQCDFQSAVTVL